MLAPPVSAEVLIARSADGDRSAFDQLAERLVPSALMFATRVLGERALAEDAVQEALVKLWKEAHRFDPARGAFSPWWRRVLMNACLDGRRRLRPVEQLDATIPDNGRNPEQAAQAFDLRRRLDAAMARLLPRQRAALALFHGEGLSMTEVADVLETTPKAVEGLLTRARAELRARLEGIRNEL